MCRMIAPTSRGPAGDPGKLGDEAATWEPRSRRVPQPEGGRKGPRGGAGKLGGLRAPPARKKKPGSGRAGVGRIEAGGAAGRQWSQEIPQKFLSIPAFPASFLGADLSEPWER